MIVVLHIWLPTLVPARLEGYVLARVEKENRSAIAIPEEYVIAKIEHRQVDAYATEDVLAT